MEFGIERRTTLDKMSSNDLDILLVNMMDKMPPVITKILLEELSVIMETPQEAKPEIQQEKPVEESCECDNHSEKSNDVIRRLDGIEALLHKFIDRQETPPSPETKMPTGEETEPKQEAVSELLKQKLDSIDERLQQFEYKEKINKELHEELVKYRAGQRKEFISALLKNIIREYDRADKQYQFYLEKAKDNQQGELFGNLLKEFQILSLSMLDLLSDYDIVPFEPETGAEFAAREHKIVEGAATDEDALDGKIALCTHCGFRDTENGRILRPAEVTVYRKNK